MPETPQHNDQMPLLRIKDALKGAKDNRAPDFTEEELLSMMHLDGDQPDGRNLTKRLTGKHGLIIKIFHPQKRREMREAAHLTRNLLARLNKGTVTEQERVIGTMLANAAQRQWDREGEICNLGGKLLLRAPDDMVRPDIKKELEILAEQSNQ